MNEWWDGLSTVNQGFYTAAVAFGVIFVWQLIAALIGLDGDSADVDAADDVDLDTGDGTYDHFEHGAEADSIESLSSFHLISFRSMIAFFTLFTWGTAMYLSNGLSTSKGMTYGLLWGAVGMFVVAWLLYMLKKMTETGTMDLNSCVGLTGTVYLNIPENGDGEVNVLVSKVSTHVKARGVNGKAIEANKTVKVVKRIAQNIFEVDEV